MKLEAKTLEPKNLEKKVKVLLATNDAASDTIAAVIGEVEIEVSETTTRVDRERALDLTTGDAETAARTWGANEVARGRLKLALAALQQKYREAALREYAADWEQRYLQTEKIRDEAAEQLAEIPQLAIRRR